MAPPELSTLGEMLRWATRQLTESSTGSSTGTDSPRLDAEVLLRHLLHLDRTRLLVSLDRPAPHWLPEQYRALIDRRAAGEPVAYITGRREFMGLDFLVDPRVLIPRPETEYLVEWGLKKLRQAPLDPGDDRLVVDVGTGSGAILLSLAALTAPLPRATYVGVDVSRDAIEVASVNAARLAPGRVELVAGDLLGWCGRPIDLVLANLPYLRSQQMHGGIEREPSTALVSGDDGFDLYRRLLPQLTDRLAPAGSCICEIDPLQRDIALRTAREAMTNRQVQVVPDLAGFDRYLIIEPK